MAKESRLLKIPIAREYEAKIGINTAQQRKAVVRIFRPLMRTLRAVLKRNSEIFYEGSPTERRVCDTCAFSRKTDRWRGFLATTYGLMGSIRNHKVFICHHNQPMHCKNQIDSKRLMVCMGFALVVDDEEAKRATEEAYTAIQPVLAVSEGVESGPRSNSRADLADAKSAVQMQSS